MRPAPREGASGAESAFGRYVNRLSLLQPVYALLLVNRCVPEHAAPRIAGRTAEHPMEHPPLSRAFPDPRIARFEP